MTGQAKGVKSLVFLPSNEAVPNRPWLLRDTDTADERQCLWKHGHWLSAQAWRLDPGGQMRSLPIQVYVTGMLAAAGASC